MTNSHFTSLLVINYKRLFANVIIIHLNIAVLNIYNFWNSVGQGGHSVGFFFMTFSMSSSASTHKSSLLIHSSVIIHSFIHIHAQFQSQLHPCRETDWGLIQIQIQIRWKHEKSIRHSSESS